LCQQVPEWTNPRRGWGVNGSKAKFKIQDGFKPQFAVGKTLSFLHIKEKVLFTFFLPDKRTLANHYSNHLSREKKQKTE
jgi:hypothetical protein